MPIPKTIIHIYEPTPLQCGQAVLAMLTGKSVADIITDCKTDRETKFKDMESILNKYGIFIIGTKTSVTLKDNLPKIALLSLETPKCWHWSLYINGKFYDPEYGLINDFPPSKRRYFWELKEI